MKQELFGKELSGKKFDNLQHLKEIVIAIFISEFVERHGTSLFTSAERKSGS